MVAVAAVVTEAESPEERRTSEVPGRADYQRVVTGPGILHTSHRHEHGRVGLCARVLEVGRADSRAECRQRAGSQRTHHGCRARTDVYRKVHSLLPLAGREDTFRATPKLGRTGTEPRGDRAEDRRSLPQTAY